MRMNQRTLSAAVFAVVLMMTVSACKKKVPPPPPPPPPENRGSTAAPPAGPSGADHEFQRGAALLQRGQSATLTLVRRRTRRIFQHR